MFSEEVNTLIFVAILLLVIVTAFVLLAGKIKRKGHSMQTVFYGATDEFLNVQEKNAIEYVLEEKGGKKMFEQKSGDPDSKDSDPPATNSN